MESWSQYRLSPVHRPSGSRRLVAVPRHRSLSGEFAVSEQFGSKHHTEVDGRVFPQCWLPRDFAEGSVGSRSTVLVRLRKTILELVHARAHTRVHFEQRL